MRDYYSLLKFLRRELSKGAKVDADLFAKSVCRNFGGQPNLSAEALRIFGQHCHSHIKDARRVAPHISYGILVMAY